MSVTRLAPFAAALALLAGATQASATPQATKTTIASIVTTDARIVISATKGSGGNGAPPATVQIAAFRLGDGSAHLLGRLTVGESGGFFWKVLTGPRSIRDLSFTGGGSQRLSFRLLITPSIGWSGVFRFRLDSDRLVAT
jgi:hypothetical protein